MTALQQRIHVAPSLVLLEAILGRDLVTKLSLLFQRERSYLETLLHFEPISLSTICLVSAVISGFAEPFRMACLSL
jgi:hypothetical protein